MLKIWSSFASLFLPRSVPLLSGINRSQTEHLCSATAHNSSEHHRMFFRTKHISWGGRVVVVVVVVGVVVGRGSHYEIWSFNKEHSGCVNHWWNKNSKGPLFTLGIGQDLWDGAWLSRSQRHERTEWRDRLYCFAPQYLPLYPWSLVLGYSIWGTILSQPAGIKCGVKRATCS